MPQKPADGPDINARYRVRLTWDVFLEEDDPTTPADETKEPFSHTKQVYRGFSYGELCVCQKSLADTITGWGFAELRRQGADIPQFDPPTG